MRIDFTRYDHPVKALALGRRKWRGGQWTPGAATIRKAKEAGFDLPDNWGGDYSIRPNKKECVVSGPGWKFSLSANEVVAVTRPDESLHLLNVKSRILGLKSIGVLARRLMTSVPLRTYDDRGRNCRYHSAEKTLKAFEIWERSPPDAIPSFYVGTDPAAHDKRMFLWMLIFRRGNTRFQISMITVFLPVAG